MSYVEDRAISLCVDRLGIYQRLNSELLEALKAVNDYDLVKSDISAADLRKMVRSAIRKAEKVRND